MSSAPSSAVDDGVRDADDDGRERRTASTTAPTVA